MVVLDTAQHGVLVLEVAVVVVEVHLCLVYHLEIAAVLENLCLMERRLELRFSF